MLLPSFELPPTEIIAGRLIRYAMRICKQNIGPWLILIAFFSLPPSYYVSDDSKLGNQRGELLSELNRRINQNLSDFQLAPTHNNDLIFAVMPVYLNNCDVPALFLSGGLCEY